MAFNKMFQGDSAVTKALPYGDKSVQQYLVTSGAPVPKAIPLNGGRGSQGGPTAAEQDIWAHQPNNITSGDEYKLEFLPNLLDNYDVYTYHWKLFITSLEHASSGKVMRLENQVIIAESGVSDLTIDKVELHGITGPSIEAGTGTQTLVKFEIIEPSGAGLLDKMFYQASALGIGNWLVMPCFLQLEFRGRDPITSNAVESGGPSALAGLKWVWPIKLTNSKANVTQVGTRYEFDAIIYDELAQSNSYFAIQHNVTLGKLEKFGDAMRDLEDKLNADQYEKLIDNYSIPDTYSIVVDPELEDAGITKANDNKSTSFGADYINFSKKTAAFNAGTGIDKIIDAILGNTDKFQKLMQGSATSTSQPKAANQVVDQMKKLWRIVTETKPIAFDMLRQDNAVAITIYIVKYDLGVADVNPSQTGQTPETIAAAKRRMAEYVHKKIMNKKYNYIFTGLNDQIFNFDLNMNFSFAASLSRFGGVYYDSAIKMPGVAVQKKNDDAEKKATERIREILQFINSATPGKNTDAKIKEARKALNDATIDPVLKSRYINLLDHAKKVDRQTYVAQISQAGGISASGTLQSKATTAEYLSKPVNGLKFISDVNINSPEAKAAYDIAISSRKGKLRPVPYREGQNETALSSGIDPSSNAGRSRVANIFATALYSTLDASLQSIKLTIKGDPYWLYPRNVDANVDTLPYKSNMPNSVAIQSIKNTKDTTAVNPLCTDNFIVIRFRTPRIFDETTGTLDPFTEVETFSGVYKVISILNKFEAGKFSQELTCILDPVINLSDFLKDMEAAAKKLDVVQVPQPSTLPITAVKTQKLAGTVDALKGQSATTRDAVTGAVVNTQNKVFGKVADTATSNLPPILRT